MSSTVAPADNGNTPCKHCGSQDQSWQTRNIVLGPAQDGRLKVSEVECQFVFGCNHCSETLLVLSADRLAALMNGSSSGLGTRDRQKSQG